MKRTAYAVVQALPQKFHEVSVGRFAMTGAMLLFAIIGTLLLVSSHAATPTASFEAESGTVIGGAAAISDTNSSGGGAVKFNMSVVGACAQPKRTITAADVSNQTNSGYAAGTQVYVPDGPDPWGGCFPGPSNTGVPAGTALTAYTGPCTISAANTVIDAKTITCDITVQAANVQIKNSKITAGNIDITAGSLTLTDSEVNFGSNVNDEGLKGNNFTVLRANMYGGKRQVWCNSTCTLQDSYLHDQLSDPTGVTHESAVRVEQYTTLRHNSLLCNAPDYPPRCGLLGEPDWLSGLRYHPRQYYG